MCLRQKPSVKLRSKLLHFPAIPVCLHHLPQQPGFILGLRFGRNTSAIGLATNPTLDPATPNFGWTDRGIVIQTTTTTNNAIDPVVRDESDNLWLVFGSYWSGINLVTSIATIERNWQDSEPAMAHDIMKLIQPATDPTPIVEHFRGIHGTELLTAAVSHFKLFDKLAEKSLSAAELRHQLGLAERPFVVLTTALSAMKLLRKERDGRFALTELAREHLVAGAPFDMSSYVGLAAQNPSVLEMVERLKTNRPRGSDKDAKGTEFIYREGTPSAMDEEESARRLTLSLSGRARNVAPLLAEAVPLDGVSILLDIGGGSGIYSYALLRRNPQLRGIILDRAEVNKVAREIADEFAVASRVEFMDGDMFAVAYPRNVDAVLLSNVLHDWDVAECRQLVGQAAEALAPGGQLIIHDVFLNDDMDGPLPVALYSAVLFALTEGRAYSGAEYRAWMEEAGLNPRPIVPTLIHCGALVGVKR